MRARVLLQRAFNSRLTTVGGTYENEAARSALAINAQSLFSPCSISFPCQQQQQQQQHRPANQVQFSENLMKTEVNDNLIPVSF